MKELIAKYLRYLEVEKRYSTHTIDSYRRDLHQLLEFVAEYADCSEEEIQIEQIDRLVIRLWLGRLAENDAAKSSMARKTASIRSFFKYLYRRGHINKNPAHLLIVPKKEKRLPTTVHPEEIRRMMELADGTTPRELQDRAILELLYGSGIRLRELTGLNVDDLDLKAGQVRILGKGSRQRIVPLGSRAAEALQHHLKHRGELFGKRSDSDAHKALFLAASGHRIYPRAVQKLVRRYLEKTSEITQKSPHVLRHSFATHMLDAGADIRIIKEFLGHTNLSATQVYTHTSVERLKKVYDQAHPRSEPTHHKESTNNEPVKGEEK